jgi:hypothetical protein
MRHRILYLILLNLLFATLIGLAVVLGHGQPLDAKVRQLHLDHCMPPCWIGTIPGLTTEKEARTLFSAVYPERTPFFIASNDQGGSLQVQAHLDAPAPSNQVPTILIGDLNNFSGVVALNSSLMPRLGDVLLLWGVPTCVFPEVPDYWTLYYNTGNDRLGVMIISMHGNRFSPSQPIYSLLFYRVSAEFIPRCSRPDAKQWGGFTTLP